MIRRLVAAAIAVCLTPASLSAQSTALTVTVPSAEIYQAPSTGSPIVGQATRGTVLTVTRDLGSWVKVPWPGARDDVGYVHVSRGTLQRGSESASKTLFGESTSPRPTPAAPEPAALRAAAQRPAAPRPAPVRPVAVAPSTHRIGVGGQIAGSPLGYGASARAWGRDRFGAQLQMSHYALQSIDPSQRVTSMRFEPSALYSPWNMVRDYVWTRPYAGAGVAISRQTLSDVSGGLPSISESKTGLRVFGGGEFTFASAPRFAVSVDVGYQWARASSLPGVTLGGPGAAVSGHWYMK